MKNIHIPRPGQRILRSMIAVWICVALYYIHGRIGIPFMMTIIAVACIQPYTESMFSAALMRIVGTTVGTVWAALMLFIEYRLRTHTGLEEAAHLIMSGVLVGVILYTMALMKQGVNAYFAVVVFLGIVMNHGTDPDSALYIINRMLETMIGVLIGTFVNSVHLPRVRHDDILFVFGVNQVLTEEHHLTPYTKVELNHLIREGAKFTIATGKSPATLFDVTQGVKMKCPVVAFNGAVLYNMENRHYISSVKIDAPVTEQINTFIRERDPQHFVLTLEDDLMTIYYHDMVEGTMKHRYLKQRRSLYRNYVHTDREICENVICFVLLGTVAEIREMGEEILAKPWAHAVRIEYDDYECEEDELIMRIYSCDATREKMFARLKEDLGIREMIKFGLPEDGFDEVLPYVGDRMVREIKRRFETVSLRGWRNILHL